MASLGWLIGGPSAAARTGAGAVLILIIVLLWVLEGALAGGVAGLGLASWRSSGQELSEKDAEAFGFAREAQRLISWLARGGLAVWLVSLGLAGFGPQEFFLLWGFVFWPVLVLVGSIALLGIFSAWQKVRRFGEVEEGADWVKRISRGMIPLLEKVMLASLQVAVVALVLTGVAWMVQLASFGWRLEQTGSACFGLLVRGSAWWRVVASVIALVHALCLVFQILQVKKSALAVVIEHLALLLLDRLPLDRLPSLPQAPSLFRTAVQAPAGLPLPVRWAWRLVSRKLDPVLEHWDAWTVASDPKSSLKSLLGSPEPGDPLPAFAVQIVLAVLTYLVL